MHPRYFIGLMLPEDIGQKITRIQRELFLPKKVMEPLVPHITLLDPNILQSVSPMYLVPKLQDVSKSLMPVTIKLSGIGTFHNSILHITVESPMLIKLHSEMAALLPDKVKAQYSVGRDFVPHITLIQAKPKQHLQKEVIHEFESRINGLLPYSFQAMNLTQFTWKRPRQYEVKPI